MSRHPKSRRGAPLPAAEIREAYRLPTLRELAERFGCHESAVSRILSGQAWPGAGGPIATPAARQRAREAGRPRGQVVGVRLANDTVEAVDRLRGGTPRSTWVAEATEERVRRNAGDTGAGSDS